MCESTQKKIASNLVSFLNKVLVAKANTASSTLFYESKQPLHLQKFKNSHKYDSKKND